MKTPLKQLLRHFIQEDYSRSEYRQIIDLFAESNDDELKEQLQNHWNDIPDSQPLNTRLQMILANFRDQTIFTRKKRNRSLLNYYQKIAAVLFIPLLLGFSLWIINSKPEISEATATINSPEGARVQFELPDGTTGWLNSGSTLTYPVTFSGDRDVKLTGEAFFDVVHRERQKFVVKANGLTIQDIGTSFNVTAYDDVQHINVVLKSGVVKLFDDKDREIYTMKPNEEFSYDRERDIANVKQVNAADFTSWTEGILRFRGEPLEEVMKKLSRWYNVDIEMNDRKLNEYKFNATFKDEQLDEILRMIAMTTPMKYKIEKRKLNINGTYVKKKIIIESD